MLSRLFARKQDTTYRRFKRPEVRHIDDIKIPTTIQMKPKWFVNYPKSLVLYEEDQRIYQYTVCDSFLEKKESITKTIKE